MSKMVRVVFNYKLKELQAEILDIGSMVEKAVYQAVDALKRRDSFLANLVIKDDQKINERRLELEDHTLTLIATQQPVVAHDLRLAASSIIIASELERMGDHAKGIARISNLIGDKLLDEQCLNDILTMSKLAGLMLHDALDAFVKTDVDMARQVAARDDRLDTLFDNLSKHLVQTLIANRNMAGVDTYLLWACHNLERIGDRVTNICERVVFIGTGELPNLGHLVEQDAELVAAQSDGTASATLELED